MPDPTNLNKHICLVQTPAKITSLFTCIKFFPHGTEGGAFFSFLIFTFPANKFIVLYVQ